MHKRPVHHRQLLIQEIPSRYTIKCPTLTTTNACKTAVVILVETDSRASVKTGGIINTSEMSVLFNALMARSAKPVYSMPSLEPTNGLSPCWCTAKIDCATSISITSKQYIKSIFSSGDIIIIAYSAWLARKALNQLCVISINAKAAYIVVPNINRSDCLTVKVNLAAFALIGVLAGRLLFLIMQASRPSEAIRSMFFCAGVNWPEWKLFSTSQASYAIISVWMPN